MCVMRRAASQPAPIARRELRNTDTIKSLHLSLPPFSGQQGLPDEAEMVVLVDWSGLHTQQGHGESAGSKPRLTTAGRGHDSEVVSAS